MAQKTDAELTTQAGVIAAETVAGANTKTRVATMFTDSIDSKTNNDKIDTANTLDTADKTVPGRDAVKEYINTQIITVTVVPISTGTVLDETAYGKVHEFSGTSADYQVDLPTAVGHSGETIAFKGLAAFTKVATLTGVSSQTIDGETTRKISSRGIMVLKSDGTNFVVYHEVGSWIPWTPVFTGFSSDPTAVDAKYFRMGNKIDMRVSMTNGTGSGTGFTMTIPFQSLLTTYYTMIAFNAGAGVSGRVNLAVGTNVATLFPAGSGGNWTTGAGKGATLNFQYEKQ